MASKLLTNRFRHLLFSSTAKIRASSFTTASSSPPFRCKSSSKSSPASPSSAGIDCATAADIADVPEEGFEDLVDAVSPASTASVANTMIPTLLQPRVVVYDGVCHLCHRGVKWVIKADKYKKIKFCCLQSRAAEPYLRLSGLDREDISRRFLFVEGYGSYYQASAAALKEEDLLERFIDREELLDRHHRY
ncbi:uncharacterized protein LOC111019215 isoform X2 [Momordica charantia]|uniref:Uncharacterized protein LOC111019215 isoform X2 n=1 Tax=Momordica charantia TaxID=3673 RepID=A0A6J1DE19_MOMCH|nr:uncharacterized protein LOC111019215 isoform X2 [Momordica charantia]